MDWMELSGMAMMIVGFAVIALNALTVLLDWQAIPPNVFIIGLGLVVIGLALLWNAREDTITS